MGIKSPKDKCYFNPRSSCEERRHGYALHPHENGISIHAPHARSDNLRLVIDVYSIPISIHAPHARSDKDAPIRVEAARQFQSTLLMRGATRVLSKEISFPLRFQSTLLMRGATSGVLPRQRQRQFQSTLLMRGATAILASSARLRLYFNPRSSCEERLRQAVHSYLVRSYFNPRSSCEERPTSTALSCTSSNFNPRSSCEERPGVQMCPDSVP